MTMRPFTSTISIDEARAIIAAGTPRIERRERVPAPRGATAACWPPTSSPRRTFRRSIAPAWTVRGHRGGRGGRHARTAAVVRLAGRVYTGDVPTVRVEPGTCIEIATGAPMPDGADAVIMVEETALDGDECRCSRAGEERTEHRPARGGHLDRPDRAARRRRAERRAGSARWPRSATRTPRRGRGPRSRSSRPATKSPRREHHCRPARSTTSTGSRSPPSSPSTAVSRCRSRTARDTLEALHAALDECLRHDVIVFSGGSSVGERDLILDVIRDRGEVRFHGIAVKPGKPTLFGHVQGTPVFGMPGYPTSCLSNAYILLVPALRQMARLPLTAPRTVALPLAARVTSVRGRHQFYTVRVERGRRCLRSRHPATSRRCRAPTAISRLRRRSPRLRRGRGEGDALLSRESRDS